MTVVNIRHLVNVISLKLLTENRRLKKFVNRLLIIVYSDSLLSFTCTFCLFCYPSCVYSLPCLLYCILWAVRLS